VTTQQLYELGGGEAQDDTSLTFACFPFSACNGSALDSLFTPVLILTTPAFGTACVAPLFGKVDFGGAPDFGAV
jgi:hypothetical protein